MVESTSESYLSISKVEQLNPKSSTGANNKVMLKNEKLIVVNKNTSTLTVKTEKKQQNLQNKLGHLSLSNKIKKKKKKQTNNVQKVVPAVKPNKKKNDLFKLAQLLSKQANSKPKTSNLKKMFK